MLPCKISLHKSFNVKSSLLFKFHITHLYCRKLKGKEKFEKRFSQLRKQFCDVIKCHVINFVCLLKLVFLSQKTKIYNNTILANYKRFVLPENQLIFAKNCENSIKGIVFLRKSMVPGVYSNFFEVP